jgi:AdoMet-dependent rRNA methyltransferase SPB1
MGPEALLKQKIKQTRHREGYAEGISSSHAPLGAAAFILSPEPVEALGRWGAAGVGLGSCAAACVLT